MGRVFPILGFEFVFRDVLNDERIPRIAVDGLLARGIEIDSERVADPADADVLLPRVDL